VLSTLDGIPPKPTAGRKESVDMALFDRCELFHIVVTIGILVLIIIATSFFDLGMLSLVGFGRPWSWRKLYVKSHERIVRKEAACVFVAIRVTSRIPSCLLFYLPDAPQKYPGPKPALISR
jgi:hypothetical protein